MSSSRFLSRLLGLSMIGRARLLAVAVTVLQLLPLSYGITDLAGKYPFNVTLKQGQYYLYWNFSSADESIQFAVRVRTTGWIGFGLSPSGQMIGSDVVIGWIGTDSATTYFHDRFASEETKPPIDPVQNWFLTNSEEENGYTQLEFERKFITCDDRDREILTDTSHIVYSWNDNEPTITTGDNGEETFTIMRHQERGSTSLNLLGGLPTPPKISSDANSFIIGVNEVEIPAQDTTYYCQGIRLNESIINQEHYIVKISPAISANSIRYVHHLAVFICNGLEEEDLSAGGDCDTGVSSRVSNCMASLIFLADWVVGGKDFFYPDNVAYPIGGPGREQFAVIQIHYNNPNFDSGVVDSSGLEFTYINTRREHDAGILLINHDLYPMFIPPGAPNYLIPSFCPGSCTDKFFPDEGIHIFADLLHTHLIGTGLELSVVDETTCPSGESRTEQTKIIDKNLNYDFNFQQFNHLAQEITVKPGSTLVLNCYYNSMSRSDVTIGGESTSMEMCVAVLAYYPRIDLADCASRPSFNQFVNFINDHVPDQYQEQFGKLRPDSSPADMIAILGLVEWSDENIEEFYNSVYKNGTQEIYCNDYTTYDTQPLPNICCPYEAEDQCTGASPVSCCERTQCLSVSDSPAGMATLTATLLTLLLGLICLMIFFQL